MPSPADLNQTPAPSRSSYFRFLYWEYFLHSRLVLLLYLFILAFHVTVVYFDLQTTLIGVALCHSTDCESNPFARDGMQSLGLRGWYNHNFTLLSLETAILLGILIIYIVVPHHPSLSYTIAQSFFLGALFYMALSIILGSLAVAGNLASIRELITQYITVLPFS